MAQFPQGLSAIDARCNTGERRVLHQLKRCLGDDHLIWHDVPIGPRARQPDFVILSPRWGLLVLEVKDWKRGTLQQASRDAVELHTARGAVTVPHPLRQVRDVTLELVDLMKADPALVHADGPFRGRLLFPHGHGVVLSALKQGDVDGSALARAEFDELFPPNRVLLRDDLDEGVEPMDFMRRLSGMFTVSYPHTLTLPQRDRIRWHLFPEIRLPTQGRLDFEPAPQLPDLLQVMDLQQEQIARTLGDGHRVIHGAAGSGKTMILIYRAQFLAATAQPGQPILVLCFNRTLADRIEALLRARGVDERVQVRTFHAWCQDMVRSFSLDVPSGLKGDAHFEALAGAVERAVESGRLPQGQYHALLLDEAHDFAEPWLRIAARMVSPATRHLLVLYDDAQSIYRGDHQGRRRLNFARLGIEARGRTSILRLNYRNTAEVLALAMRCTEELLAPSSQATTTNDDDAVPLVLPASAGRRGPLPVLVRSRHAEQEAMLIAERIDAALAAGAAPDTIAVLARTRALLQPLARVLAKRGWPVQSMAAEAFRRFDWRRPSIKLLTMHSAKGLEFAQVFVIGLQALPREGEALADAARLLYVAMTRATQALVLSAQGESPLVERVTRALDGLAPGYALSDSSGPAAAQATRTP